MTSQICSRSSQRSRICCRHMFAQRRKQEVNEASGVAKAFGRPLRLGRILTRSATSRLKEFPPNKKVNRSLDAHAACAIQTPRFEEHKVVKTKKRKQIRKPYNAADIKLLRQHSKSRTPVTKIAKLMKRSEGSLRQKALTLGIGLGHQR